MSESNRVIVIMAGGAGERFWPVSNRNAPKQLLRLYGDRSLLEMAFDRARRFVPPDRIYIAAGARLEPAIRKALPDLGERNYIAEPFARNTAACLGLAACALASLHGPETAMGVLTADHVIEEGPDFDRAVEAAMARAEKSDDLVTIGIEPTAPDTAFGYLELGEQIDEAHTAAGNEAIYRVRRFTEKPDEATARKFVESGHYLWNSGMFFWKAGALLEEFERHQPAMASGWRRLREAEAFFDAGLLNEVFESLPSLPIDVAIMEKSGNVAGVRGRFGWDDVGSWDALARIRETDESGNCAVGPAILLDSRNNILYNEASGDRQIPEIVLSGVEDMVVVRTERAIMITPRSRVQNVKSIVAHLKEKGRGELL